MPVRHLIAPDRETHWTIEQTFAWIPWRDFDRVDDLAAWSTPEGGKAWVLLRPVLIDGTIRASRRTGKGGPRQPIDRLEWLDVELRHFPAIGPNRGARFIGQDEPRFYYQDTPARDFAAAIAEPWHDVLFDVDDLLKVYPPADGVIVSRKRGKTKAAQAPVRRKPTLVEKATAALRQLYSDGRDARDNYEVLRYRLRTEKGIEISTSTLERALKQWEDGADLV